MPFVKTFDREESGSDLSIPPFVDIKNCKVQGTEIYGVYELNFNCPWE